MYAKNDTEIQTYGPTQQLKLLCVFSVSCLSVHRLDYRYISHGLGPVFISVLMIPRDTCLRRHEIFMPNGVKRGLGDLDIGGCKSSKNKKKKSGNKKVELMGGLKENFTPDAGVTSEVSSYLHTSR